MIQHNNEKDCLHLLCTYIHDGDICRLICKDKYPTVLIRTSAGTYKEVEASTLFHVSLNDSLLDKIATETKELPTGKIWIFTRKDRIPGYVFHSHDKGKYNYTNPVAISRAEQPFPIYTLDSLQNVHHTVTSNPDTHRLYTRLKVTNSLKSTIILG